MAKKFYDFEPAQVPGGRHHITGTANFAAVRGMQVIEHGTNEGEIILANGKAGYALRRDVIATAGIKAAREEASTWDERQDFQTPYEQGSAALAEDYEEFWAEGGVLDASMDNTVVAGQKVTTAAGKYAKLTNAATQECGWVVVQAITAKNTPGGKRFKLQKMRTAKT